jgi:hypothetical protein
MNRTCLRVSVLLAFAVSACAGQPAKSQAKAGATASGVFMGRSGKPMAKATLILGEVTGDQDVSYAKIKVLGRLSSAAADDQGRFQFKGIPPGMYAILYYPGAAPALLPVEINIKAFVAVTKSIAPLLVRFELGKTEPFAERVWGREFTLLKGHTFFSEGEYMKIWNATIRRNPGGPYMEIRRGSIWIEQLSDKSQIKFEAWSF